MSDSGYIDDRIVLAMSAGMFLLFATIWGLFLWGDYALYDHGRMADGLITERTAKYHRDSSTRGAVHVRFFYTVTFNGYEEIVEDDFFRLEGSHIHVLYLPEDPDHAALSDWPFVLPAFLFHAFWIIWGFGLLWGGIVVALIPIAWRKQRQAHREKLKHSSMAHRLLVARADALALFCALSAVMFLWTVSSLQKFDLYLYGHVAKGVVKMRAQEKQAPLDAKYAYTIEAEGHKFLLRSDNEYKLHGEAPVYYNPDDTGGAVLRAQPYYLFDVLLADYGWLLIPAAVFLAWCVSIFLPVAMRRPKVKK